MHMECIMPIPKYSCKYISHVYINKINSHYSIHNDSIKISSHWLITIQTIHFQSLNSTKKNITNHMNSKTLGSALFTTTQVGISSLDSKILIPITRPSRPQQIPIHKMALSQRINQVGKDPYLLELSELHKIGAHA